MKIKELKILQLQMLAELQIPKGKLFLLKDTEYIFTLDVQYENEYGFIAIHIQQKNGENQELYAYKLPVLTSYIPGFFAFKEGPLLLKSLEKLMDKIQVTPSLIIVDGHGTAHPRKMGIASWVGIKTGIPTIGVAKDPLLKTEYKSVLGKKKGDYLDVLLDKEIVGYILRSNDEVKPIFVSAGHLISQEDARNEILKLCGEYRIIDPIRFADQYARKASKGDSNINWI